MSELRRWHPWRRRLRALVLRWLGRVAPVSPEPRWRRVASAREEQRIKQRLRRRLVAGKAGRPVEREEA